MQLPRKRLSRCGDTYAPDIRANDFFIQGFISLDFDPLSDSCADTPDVAGGSLLQEKEEKIDIRRAAEEGFLGLAGTPNQPAEPGVTLVLPDGPVGIEHKVPVEVLNSRHEMRLISKPNPSASRYFPA